MAKPKLPKINIRFDELAEASNNAEQYGDIVNVVVDEVVKKATLQLDQLMEEIQERLLSDGPIPDDDLNYYIALLPTMMYFTTDRAELVGIKMDASSSIRKEKYDDYYILAVGKTIPDKESETRQLVMNETVIENAYKRAYKKVQAKLEQADKVLSSLKRVQNWRMIDIDLQSRSGGIKFNARNKSKKDR